MITCQHCITVKISVPFLKETPFLKNNYYFIMRIKLDEKDNDLKLKKKQMLPKVASFSIDGRPTICQRVLIEHSITKVLLIVFENVKPKLLYFLSITLKIFWHIDLRQMKHYILLTRPITAAASYRIQKIDVLFGVLNFFLH